MTTIKIYPIADTYISQGYTGGNPATNYGTQPVLSVGADISFFTKYFNAILMRFSLSDIPADSIIVSTKLRMFIIDGDNYCNAYYIRNITDKTWTETGATWNTVPAYDNVYPSIRFSGVDPTNVDITSYVRDQYNLGIDVDLRIDQMYSTSYCAGYGGYTRYGSRSNTDPTKRPYLEITYIPGATCVAPKVGSYIAITKLNNTSIDLNPKLVVGTNTIIGDFVNYTYTAISGQPLKLEVIVENITLIDTTINSTGILPNYNFDFIMPTLMPNGIDVKGKTVIIRVSHTGNVYCTSLIEIETMIDGVSLNADKTIAHFGESIRFSGTYLPNQSLNMYYCSKTIIGTAWREHVTGIVTDVDGKFDTIAIIPSDATDANGNRISLSATLDFRVCATTGSLPGEECKGGLLTCTADTVSRSVSIVIITAPSIRLAPNKYVKTFSDANTYNGLALTESMHASAAIINLTTETKIVSIEEATYNVQMIIETAALQQGFTLLQSEISYSQTVTTYEFDVKYTYIKPLSVMSSMGNATVYSAAIPLLYAALIIVGAIIIAAIVFGDPIPVVEGLWGAITGAVGTGIGLIVIAGGALLLLSTLGKSAVKKISS